MITKYSNKSYFIEFIIISRYIFLMIQIFIHIINLSIWKKIKTTKYICSLTQGVVEVQESNT